MELKGLKGKLKHFLEGHIYSPNVLSEKVDKHKKRRYYICKKCGKKKYID